VNDSPANRSDYANWKAFITALAQLFDVPSLIVLPIGVDYNGVFTTNGFFACIGKLSSEIDLGVDGNTPKSLTLTFTAMSGITLESALRTTITASGYLPTTTPTQGVAVDYPNITSGHCDSIEDDQYVII
jgi:hypothetical protein